MAMTPDELERMALDGLRDAAEARARPGLDADTLEAMDGLEAQALDTLRTVAEIRAEAAQPQANPRNTWLRAALLAGLGVHLLD